MSSDKQFRQGVDQFNARKFFEAHETWEEIWLAVPEPEKTFLQGIIQVAAAFHHHSRGNLAGARSLLQAGLAKLERYPHEHHGLNVEKLCSEARRWLAALDGGDDRGLRALPRIEQANAQ